MMTVGKCESRNEVKSYYLIKGSAVCQYEQTELLSFPSYTSVQHQDPSELMSGKNVSL